MINAERLFTIIGSCMHTEVEVKDLIMVEGVPQNLPEGSIVVPAILHTFVLSSRVEGFRKEVAKMLEQMEDNFFDDTGGGYSFLNFVATKDGELWGEQIDAEGLYVMAAALGMAKFSTPKPEHWAMFPGSMPYITLIREKVNEALAS